MKTYSGRSYFDRSDGGTSLCLDALCPRTLPRGVAQGSGAPIGFYKVFRVWV